MTSPLSSHGTDLRVGVSVVVPARQSASSPREPYLGQCLRSLAKQTLAREMFEVIVVVSGREPLPLQAAGFAIRREFPALRMRMLEVSAAGEVTAINLGVAAANHEYVTVISEDSWVPPEFLRSVLASASPRAAVVTDLVEVGGVDDVIAREHGDATAGIGAVRLMPTVVARAVPFPNSAVSQSADTIHWFAQLTHVPLEVRVQQSPIATVYRRSNDAASFLEEPRFLTAVLQPLDLIARLDQTTQSAQPVVREGALKVKLAVAHQLNGFLHNDRSAHSQVIHAILARNIEGFPYQVLNEGLAEDLVIAYGFPPYADTSGLVFARRTRERAAVVDVVSQDLSRLKEMDPTALQIVEEYIDHHAIIEGRAVVASWKRVSLFCQRGLEEIAAFRPDDRPYRNLYSRAMWPGSHFLAALYKLRHPQTWWIAEFSDPILRHIHDESRTSPILDDEIYRELHDGLIANGLPVPAELNVYAWTEHLAYALADELLFTNEHQLEYMLGYCDEQLRPRVAQLSRFEHHPQPPPEFYTRAETSLVFDEDVVNIGYFGAFYATRGLTEVTAALGELDPELRSRIRLHTFTPSPADLAADAEAADLSDVIVSHPYVPYFEFLRLTTLLDVLLVDDFRTAETHPINPFLPSKWSDYQGSQTPVWAVIEPGSVMSTMPVQYQSELGDVAGARRALELMVADKDGQNDPRSEQALDEGGSGVVG